MNYEIIIIGAGPGGYVAAERAAAQGKRVLLIEKEFLGGTCLNWGCIPTKTLLFSSKLYYQAQNSDSFGITTTKVIFDSEKAYQRKEKVVSSLRNGIAGLMKRLKVEVIQGEARLVGPNNVQVGDKNYSGQNIILATGASPAKPPIPGIGLPLVVDSTKILTESTLPQKLVIIGGGIIGVEFACYYGSLGIPVTVIEMLPEICPGIDTDIAKTLRSELEHKNIAFYLNSKVTEIAPDGVKFKITENEQFIEADMVLVATGRTPNLKNIGLEALGVDVDRFGIKVDEHCRTNLPNVWAIGDCNGKMQLAHVASRQAEVVVNNICGKSDRMRYEAIPAVVYTSPEVATVGLSEAQAKERSIPIKVAKLPLSLSGRFLAENEGTRGVVKVIVHAETNILLGVQMLGNLASEAIWGASAMIEAEFRAEEIKEIVFPHPTVGEIIKDTVFSLNN